MRWIPIKDRLPEDNEEVWVYADGEVIIGSHNRYGWSHVYGDDDGLGDDRLYHVTHWQPLPRPEPPDEVKDAA
jgi:hypothetical protein